MNVLLGEILRELKEHLDNVCENNIASHKSCSVLKSLYDRYAELYRLPGTIPTNSIWIFAVLGCTFIYFLFRYNFADAVSDTESSRDPEAKVFEPFLSNSSSVNNLESNLNQIAENDSDISESIGESDVSSATSEEQEEQDVQPTVVQGRR